MTKTATKRQTQPQKTNVLRAAPSNEPVRTGLDKKVRTELADGLSRILASTYLLVIKTHIYHWNVVGPLFHSIHEMTEEQYNDLFQATDVIAERIRALGITVPHGKGEFLNNFVVEMPARLPTAKAMVQDLIKANEDLAREIREVAAKADEGGDFVTNDMLTARLTVHEKVVWMWRAMNDE